VAVMLAEDSHPLVSRQLAGAIQEYVAHHLDDDLTRPVAS
ncbi:MAG TPA: transcriptional regulator, partial [Thalassospira sp.]|nr:transcriptional regulator [Thalassospira sp.]